MFSTANIRLIIFYLQKPAIITHHASVRLSFISAFNQSIVLMESFSCSSLMPPSLVERSQDEHKGNLALMTLSSVQFSFLLFLLRHIIKMQL